MTFETLTVIELLLSASNYPEDKCDKIRDELSTMDKKTKAFDQIVEVFKDYPLKTDSDVMDFIQAKLDDMEDK